VVLVTNDRERIHYDSRRNIGRCDKALGLCDGEAHTKSQYDR